MKKILSLAALAMFSAGIVGCHASADIDSPDNNGSDSHYKKTTTYNNDGTQSSKTESTVTK